MSKLIKLTQGKFAIVDDEDFEYLNQWKWHVSKKRNTYYAQRNVFAAKGKQKTILMHRLLIKPDKGFGTDHINRNGLDNRRENLRQCTRSQNAQNAKLRSDNTSGYKGVTYSKTNKGYVVFIRVKGKRKYLGCFNTATEAARIYDENALIYHGEFAMINFS